MKQSIFEYAILWHPTDKQIKDESLKSKLLVHPKIILAQNERAVGMAAAMEIPQEYREQLDQIQIAIRAF